MDPLRAIYLFSHLLMAPCPCLFSKPYQRRGEKGEIGEERGRRGREGRGGERREDRVVERRDDSGNGITVCAVE